MKKYEPKQVITSSRYQIFFPTLPTEIQQDVYGRMNELLAEGRWQRITAAVLIAAILGFTVYGLAVKPDKVSILLSLFYYLVIIAFAEELFGFPCFCIV